MLDDGFQHRSLAANFDIVSGHSEDIRDPPASRRPSARAAPNIAHRGHAVVLPTALGEAVSTGPESWPGDTSREIVPIDVRQAHRLRFISRQRIRSAIRTPASSFLFTVLPPHHFFYTRFTATHTPWI